MTARMTWRVERAQTDRVITERDHFIVFYETVDIQMTFQRLGRQSMCSYGYPAAMICFEKSIEGVYAGDRNASEPEIR